jgi:hypothetical protein
MVSKLLEEMTLSITLTYLLVKDLLFALLVEAPTSWLQGQLQTAQAEQVQFAEEVMAEGAAEAAEAAVVAAARSCRDLIAGSVTRPSQFSGVLGQLEGSYLPLLGPYYKTAEEDNWLEIR